MLRHRERKLNFCSQEKDAQLKSDMHKTQRGNVLPDQGVLLWNIVFVNMWLGCNKTINAKGAGFPEVLNGHWYAFPNY